MIEFEGKMTDKEWSLLFSILGKYGDDGLFGTEGIPPEYWTMTNALRDARKPGPGPV